MKNVHIDNTSRENLAKLLAEKPLALQQLHKTARVDFCAPLIARQIIGSWTINSLRKWLAVDGYDIDGDLILICARDRIGASGRTGVYLMTVTDGKLDNWQPAYINRGSYTDKLDHLYRKSDADELRKSEYCDTIIIAQHYDYLTEHKAKPALDPSARYNLDDIRYVFRSADNTRYIGEASISARSGAGYRGEYRPDGYFADVADVIDKSGYIVADRRAELRRRAQQLRAERAQREYMATDHKQELHELSTEIAGRQKAVADRVAAASSYADYAALYSEFAGWSKGIAAIMRAFEQITAKDGEKTYKSNSAFSADVAAVRAMLADPITA